VRLSRASSAPVCIRSSGRTLHLVSPAPGRSLPSSLTHAVRTGALAVALGPQLVALVAGAADPPADGPRGAGAAEGAAGVRGRSAVRVLAVTGVLRGAELGVLVGVDLLLELLEGVLGAVGQGVEAGAVQVAGGRVVGQHVAGGEGVVGREAVQRVGQHLEGRVEADEPGDAVKWGGEREVEKSIREEESKCRRAPISWIGLARLRSTGRGDAERECGEMMVGCTWRC
jgi:hypothetical protein